MRPDQERVRNLLTDTVTLLCKNGLQYQTELRVQGVLGITLDNNDVFIVHINEKFGGDIGGSISIRNDEGDAAKTLLGGVRVDMKKSCDIREIETPVALNPKTGEVVHRRRRRSRESSTSPALLTNSSQQHTLQRPIKIPFSREDSSTSVKHTSFLNSTGNNPVEPVCEDIVDVKVKMEDDDDVIIIGQNHDSRTETSMASHGISNPTNECASMHDSYPNLRIGEIQGSYQRFGQVHGVSNSSTNSGVDGTAPPPMKRGVTSGSTQDFLGGSSDMKPGGSGPFITGIMRNEMLSGDVDPQSTSAATWDPSQMPDFGSLTAQDSQMILDGTPGCSTWDTTQQSQVPEVRTPTMPSVLNTADQSSESVCSGGPSSCFHSAPTYKSQRGSDLNKLPPRFECPICARTFARRDGLNKHVKHVHDKNPRYKCEACGKGFSVRSDYCDHHMAVHTGVKRNVCIVCKKRFTYTSALKAHASISHPEFKQHRLKNSNRVSK